MQRRLEHIIATDPIKAEEINSDQNKISLTIVIGFLIKIFKLGLIIVNICYFLGLFWFIFCDVCLDIADERDLSHHTPEELEKMNTEYFLDYYELTDNGAFRNSIVGLYFGFTTLSTVGFGDYAPRSNIERASGAFVLLSGVAIFSYLMGNFIDILGTYQDLNKDLDDGDTLAKFFGMMKHFNDGVLIDYRLKKKIEDHFDFMWNNDKNQAMKTEDDIKNYEQLPEHVQNRLYTNFLFHDFCQLFTQSYFNIPNRKA